MGLTTFIVIIVILIIGVIYYDKKSRPKPNPLPNKKDALKTTEMSEQLKKTQNREMMEKGNSSVPSQSINFDSKKYGQAIANAMNNMITDFKESTNPMFKMQGIISIETIHELDAKNLIPPTNNLENTTKFLQIYNENKLNIYEYLDPYVASDFLDLITENLYMNGGGKVELEALFKSIGVPENEINMAAAASLGKWLLRATKK